jgi:hypothetical protein
MTDELGYPDGIYQYIYNMCFLHSINIFTSFYYGQKFCGLLGMMLCFTSFNYWKYPLIKSKRRTVDMVVANIAISYHIYLSFFTKNRVLCSGLLITGSSMYPISIVINDKYKNYEIAAFCHCLLHLFIIMGVSFTYRDYYLQNTIE